VRKLIDLLDRQIAALAEPLQELEAARLPPLQLAHATR